jgi:hypothetical protein
MWGVVVKHHCVLSMQAKGENTEKVHDLMLVDI